MVKIMFVCLGNICRSPMAECVMSQMVRERGLSDSVVVASSATSYEELGNPIYPPARRKLMEKGIKVLEHRATVLDKKDIDKYDLIVAMEERNVRAIERIIGVSSKVYKLLDFTDCHGDIADPWWTGDFETTYSEIVKGCEGLLDFVVDKYNIKKHG